MRIHIFLTACLLASVNVPAAEPSRPSDAVQAFFLDRCVHCHGESTQEGGVRLDSLGGDLSDGLTRQTWVRVLNVLDAREMPPPDEPPLEPAVRRSAVDAISQDLADSNISPSTSLRRLNRREYQNTVHDLLGIDVPLMDLLPEDADVQGFDNVADGLSISSVLMEQYLEAADVAFQACIRRIKPLPAETRRIQFMEVKENIESVKKNKGGTIEVDDSFVKFTPGWPPARLDAIHPIEDGVYRCRVAVWPHDPGDRTLAVAIYVGTLFGPETRKFIGVYDVTGTSQEPRVIEFQTHLEEGHAIHIVPRVWPEHVTWRDKHEQRPGVGLVWAETHGPLDQSFPSKAQKRLFGEASSITMIEAEPIWMRHRKNVKRHVVDSSRPKEDAERIVRDLIRRAFRRPVDPSEMQPFVELTLDRLEQGRTFEQAVRAGVVAVLCSPQFLLLNSAAEVDDDTIASRLSYFLWSSMPDGTLLKLAEQGRLRDPQVRVEQVDRLLRDPRSERFVENFTGQWLDLREIEFTTPAQKLYPEFDPLLQEAMLGESRHFFRHLLDEDLSVLNFLDSDWTFLNERIARHYGIPGVQGHESFRRIDIPDDSIRGGVLTQASVLKVTANGTSTSPVVRGAWVLDHLLGRPAPPPPPGVPAVEPDIRGATTIREQLEKHREIESCAQCHRRIDPPGFALERFNAIGGQRDWYRSLGEGEKLDGKKPYRKGKPVDTASQLADGRSFDDFESFRDCLLEDREQFIRAFATKLAVYATGRSLGVADRAAIDEIVREAKASGLGLRSLIQATVRSDLFLRQ
ncbi:DUF1592 domain-containing protein [Roseiconus nitratireducens]|uniref:DUF1592 domain-containing protein n=1 Tax=Roseiconus nitratireducens TaxID=2605748 RepID=A0A5M6D904_9BACT|nr:DUF1592 domain-containing protein [Roseiconus nitratireducens]KAA5543106.1 DUF1592 domain-containing protein [Roseiconus nitratireducens]